MAWSIEIQDADGTVTDASAAEFRSARFGLTLDGPGFAEITLAESMVSDLWKPGLHRVIVHNDDPTLVSGNYFAGYVNRLERTGPPEDLDFRVYANGLSWILDKRIVRGAYEITGTTAEIVESLLDNAQGQLNGDMSFSMGVTSGTFPTKTRSYCFGVNIGDAIRELANIKRGFEWYMAADGTLNLFAPRIGVDTGLTIADTQTNDWAVAFDTEEMVTTVSALGEPSDPFGPRHDMVRSGFADDYGRREVLIDVPSNDQNELIDAATQELKARGGGMLELKARWIEGLGPWPMFWVWPGDTVTATLESYFGGTQDVRCIDVTVTLDPAPEPVWFVEHTFQTLIEDITEGDPDEESS